MKKTSKILCIILALLISFSGNVVLAQGSVNNSSSNTSSTTGFKGTKLMKKMKVTSNFKKAQKALIKGIKKMAKTIDLTKYKIPRASADFFYMGTVYDNPELFWVNSTYYYWYSGKYITKIQPVYHFTKAELPTRKKEYNLRVNQFLSSVQVGMSDYDKALVLHDKLVSENAFSYEASKLYSGYGALYDCSSVCQGYALAYSHLLEEVGIDSYLAYSEEMNHVWNIVKIDGKWYHVDATWNDPIVYNQKTKKDTDTTGKVEHKYFLINTARIKSEGYNHYNWTTFYKSFSCKSTLYHDSFDKEIYSKIIKIDDTYYYASNDYKFTTRTNDIVTTYDDKTAYTTDRVHNYIYFNDATSLYYYDINTNEFHYKLTFRTTENKTYIRGFSIISQRIFYIEKNYNENYYSLYYLTDASFPSEQIVKLKKAYNVKKGIKLTWDKAKYATSYEIYRKSKGGKYTLIKTVSGTKTSFIDTSVKNKVKYYYYIKTAPQRVTSFAKSVVRKK